MKLVQLSVVLALGAIVAGCSGQGGEGGQESAATPSTGALSFASSIQPIVAARCAKCHVDDSKGGLSLASLESTLQGGKDGAAIVAGDSEQSLLYLMVSGKAEKRMPPKGDPLSDDEIAVIQQWIDAGAH